MKCSIKIIVFAILAAGNLSCDLKSQEKKSQESAVIQVVDALKYNEMKTGEILVDIRTPEEFNNGHLENAVNINYFDSNFLEQLNKFDKSKAVFIYCRSGNRSAKASAKLKAAGFSKVVDLKGGIKSWQSNDLKVVK